MMRPCRLRPVCSISNVTSRIQCRCICQCMYIIFVIIIYTYIHIHIHMHTHACTCIHMHTHAYTYACRGTIAPTKVRPGQECAKMKAIFAQIWGHPVEAFCYFAQEQTGKATLTRKDDDVTVLSFQHSHSHTHRPLTTQALCFKNFVVHTHTLSCSARNPRGSSAAWCRARQFQDPHAGARSSVYRRAAGA